MGGAPSRAWNEAVNDAYEAGILHRRRGPDESIWSS